MLCLFCTAALFFNASALSLSVDLFFLSASTPSLKTNIFFPDIGTLSPNIDLLFPIFSLSLSVNTLSSSVILFTCTLSSASFLLLPKLFNLFYVL